MDAARLTFRPEFMNRIDEFIVFQPLDAEQINEIVRFQVCMKEGMRRQGRGCGHHDVWVGSHRLTVSAFVLF